MSEINFNINDDDEEYGIATTMGVDAKKALKHASAPGKEDVFAIEGRQGEAGGYDVYAGAGTFYVGKDGEHALVEAVIVIASELGTTFELNEISDPVGNDREVEWYREFEVDGNVLVTLTVGYDDAPQKYRMAITNEDAKKVFAATGINTPADVMWIVSDIFRYSQFE